MARTTRRDLETKLGFVNALLAKKDQPLLELDYARFYGGYCLNYADNENHVSSRMPARNMLDYLDGMHTALWMVK
jgi:hypothetical protein